MVIGGDGESELGPIGLVVLEPYLVGVFDVFPQRCRTAFDDIVVAFVAGETDLNPGPIRDRKEARGRLPSVWVELHPDLYLCG